MRHSAIGLSHRTFGLCIRVQRQCFSIGIIVCECDPRLIEISKFIHSFIQRVNTKQTVRCALVEFHTFNSSATWENKRESKSVRERERGAEEERGKNDAENIFHVWTGLIITLIYLFSFFTHISTKQTRTPTHMNGPLQMDVLVFGVISSTRV